MSTHVASSSLTRSATTRSCPRSDAGRTQRTSTRLAYERDVHRWRMAGGAIPCSAADLLAYVRKIAHRVAPMTLARRLMAIQDAHVRGGHPSPTRDLRVRTLLRVLATGRYPDDLVETGTETTPAAASKVAEPVAPGMLEKLLGAATHRSLLDRRDDAILLLCHAGLKRGTVVALDIDDLMWSDHGLRIAVRAHARPPRQVTIHAIGGALCAVSACRAWLEHSGLEGTTGPLFMRFSRGGAPVLSERLDAAYVNKILKKRLMAAGIEDVSRFSAESLRRSGSRGWS
jgi:integrase